MEQSFSSRFFGIKQHEKKNEIFARIQEYQTFLDKFYSNKKESPIYKEIEKRIEEMKKLI